MLRTGTLRFTWYRRRRSIASQLKRLRVKTGSKTELGLKSLKHHTGAKSARTNFRHVLKTLAEKGQPELIIAAFAAQIQKENLAVNEADFAIGISTCGRSKLWQHACWLLHQMPEAMANANVFTYNAAISACEKGGQWKQALNLFNSMPEAQVIQDVISYNASISACEKGGAWKKALDLFEAMPDAKVAPDVISHNAAISAW